MNVLINRCRRRAHLTEELVEEVWQQDHRDAMIARDAEEMIGECRDLGDLLHRAWETTLDSLFAGELDDIDALYPALVSTVDRAIATHRRAAEIARRAIQNGYTVEPYSEFAASIPKLDRLKAEIELKWPKDDSQMAADSLAAFHRGEFVTSEDLLRDAQGSGS